MDNPYLMNSGCRLKPLAVNGHPSPLDVIGGVLCMGRSSDNDVIFAADEFPSVSSHHLRIELVDDELWVEDLSSRNGTYVNGQTCERVRVKIGDMIQLGTIGPRFIVVSSEPLSETMFVDPKTAGLPELEISEEKVEQMVEARARGTMWRLGGVGIIAAGALIWMGVKAIQSQDERTRDITAEHKAQGERRDAEMATAHELLAQLKLKDSQQEENLRAMELERTQHASQLRQRVVDREGESKRLNTRLAALEGDESQTVEIERLERLIATTKGEIDLARQQLSSFDPINLEQLRLSEVSNVREAVALIEVELSLVDEETGAVLFMTSYGEPNFEEDGLPWTMDSTGSGFCVSTEGWILTNAHVIAPPDAEEITYAAGELPILTRTEVNVVFSGTEDRHRARIVKVAEGEIDLALIKIEPYETMPSIPNFGLDTRIPKPGSDVYTFGFPLGKFALQEGSTVIASTFRGILSRVVDGNLQVDAAVVPGNSGGPITDARGRVMGVVYSVQATPEQTAVYNIGYGIPISDAASIWPPPEDWEELLEGRSD